MTFIIIYLERGLQLLSKFGIGHGSNLGKEQVPVCAELKGNFSD